MVDVFKALAEESRLRILAMLMHEEMCVCEIEECLELTQSNASRHLTVLKNAGILTSVKKAQWAYYKLNDAFIKENQDLFRYITEKVKLLPSYEADIDQMHKCKANNLCN